MHGSYMHVVYTFQSFTRGSSSLPYIGMQYIPIHKVDGTTRVQHKSWGWVYVASVISSKVVCDKKEMVEM